MGPLYVRIVVVLTCTHEGGCRAIISKGWSSRMSKDDKDPEVEMPPECFLLDKVPHEYVNHGISFQPSLF